MLLMAFFLTYGAGNMVWTTEFQADQGEFFLVLWAIGVLVVLDILLLSGHVINL